MAFSYVVRVEAEEAIAAQFLAWLVEGHVAEVCAAGGASAEIVRLDGRGARFEARYRFASREAFAAYERDHASRLRAEGLSRFPSGLRFVRETGEVVHEVAR